MTDLVEKVAKEMASPETFYSSNLQQVYWRERANEAVKVVLAEIKAKCPEIWPVIESRLKCPLEGQGASVNRE